MRPLVLGVRGGDLGCKEDIDNHVGGGGDHHGDAKYDDQKDTAVECLCIAAQAEHSLQDCSPKSCLQQSSGLTCFGMDMLEKATHDIYDETSSFDDAQRDALSVQSICASCPGRFWA
jgi:hypothetical protein